MAQLVRASEQNSVVMDSNPLQANFLYLLLKILQWCILYVSNHLANNVITCARLHFKQMWQLMKAKTAMKCKH